MESRYFMVKCPFDIHIGFARDDKGKPVLRNLAGTQSGIRASKLGEKLHYTKDPLPGPIFWGRFPINVWPRPLMWAFKWHEPDKPIKIKRGDLLFSLALRRNYPKEASWLPKQK
jgi:hypothetical protein